MAPMWVRVLLVPALVGLALSGCATPPAGSGPPTQSTPHGTAGTAPVDVDYRRTGGFASQEVAVSVRDGREVRVSEIPSGFQASYQLTASEQETLADAVADARLDEIAGTRLTEGAADMFQYTVAAGGVSVTVDDGTMPAQLQPLVSLLNGYADRSAASTGG